MHGVPVVYLDLLRVQTLHMFQVDNISRPYFHKLLIFRENLKETGHRHPQRQRISVRKIYLLTSLLSLQIENIPQRHPVDSALGLQDQISFSLFFYIFQQQIHSREKLLL